MIRVLELAVAGLVAVLAHVAALTAVSVPLPVGAPEPPPAPRVEAGSGYRAIVASWDRPPETASAPILRTEPDRNAGADLAVPAGADEGVGPSRLPPPPAPPPAAPGAVPTVSASVPPHAGLSPDVRLDPATLPPLRRFETPPQILSPLAVASSSRPAPRPPRAEKSAADRRVTDRAAPTPAEAQPRRDPAASQSRRDTAAAAPGAAQPAATPAPRAAVRQAPPVQSAPASGGTDRLVAQWGGAISARIQRAAPRNPGGATRSPVISLRVARDGRVIDASIATSSGSAATDRAALEAVRRAGRLPGAPRGLERDSYPFILPLGLR